MFFRLCVRAPRIMIASFAESGADAVLPGEAALDDAGLDETAPDEVGLGKDGLDKD
jgi:hypothetical protein